MRTVLALGATVMLAGCVPTVNVPYFGKIPVDDLCGSYSSHCQPTVSRQWAQSDAIPFEGADTILGWTYTTDLRLRDQCANAKPPLFEERGVNAFSATVTTTERARVVAALGVDLREFIDRNFTALPDSLKAALQVKADDAVKSAVEQRVNLRYRRVEMTTPGVTTQARPCLDALPVGTKVVTGVSVISADGTWTSNRLREAANEFEASASYDELGLEGKVEYERQRDAALAGTFEPLHYVFAFSFIRKE